MAINKRKVQEVNAGSMADISFLLLIFFLIATTMNTDTGINRNLPPLQEEEQKSEQRERNVLKVFVNDVDELMVNSQRIQIEDLGTKVKDFVTNKTNSPDLPEKTMTDIEVEGQGIWQYPVSEGVVSLQNRRGTSYGRYVEVQNELAKAFNQLRDEVAIQRFGKPYADLSEAGQKAVSQAVPLKISEAEITDKRK